MSLTTLIDAAGLRAALAGRTDAGAAMWPTAPMGHETWRDPPRERPLVLLDCRFDLQAPQAGRRAYQAGHLPGASYADLNLDLAGPVTSASGRHPLPSPASLAAFCAAAGIGPRTQVVVYDDATGAYAARAWWLLRWLGHSAAVLDGGLQAWTASGGPLEAAQAQAPAGESAGASAVGRTGTTRVRFDAVATAEDVLAALGRPGRLLIDARAAERFAGMVEPIDPVAGHVPGAVNHPFTDNLQRDGRFLAPAELRRRWQERLGAVAAQDAIVMCGSGVTACHDLLAMEVAGMPGAKLYAGSWSEWIRDPGRPITRPGDIAHRVAPAGSPAS